MRISDWSSDVCSSDLGKVSAVHDCADGGLLVAVTEMALAGNIGAILEPDAGIALHAWAFGEDQARYVVTSANGADIAEAARAAGVPVDRKSTRLNSRH